LEKNVSLEKAHQGLAAYQKQRFMTRRAKAACIERNGFMLRAVNNFDLEYGELKLAISRLTENKYEIAIVNSQL
jgi:hypothetical protein